MASIPVGDISFRLVSRGAACSGGGWARRLAPRGLGSTPPRPSQLAAPRCPAPARRAARAAAAGRLSPLEASGGGRGCTAEEARAEEAAAAAAPAGPKAP